MNIYLLSPIPRSFLQPEVVKRGYCFANPDPQNAFPVFFANPDMLSRKNVEKEKAVQAVRDYYSRQLLGGPFIYTKATIT